MNLFERLFGYVRSGVAYDALVEQNQQLIMLASGLRAEVHGLRMKVLRLQSEQIKGFSSTAPDNALVKSLQKDLVRANNKIIALERQLKEKA